MTARLKNGRTISNCAGPGRIGPVPMLIAATVTLLFCDAALPAERRSISVDLLTGVALNIPIPLTISQEHEPDIELTARYASKPFEWPLYYAVRISLVRGKRAWELELIHHKLSLDNKPEEVQRFEVSHGYNLLTVNRAWIGRAVDYRLGVGVVLAHPETTVRNRTGPHDAGLLRHGYHLTGPALQLAIGRARPLGSRLHMTVEGKVTAALANLPVAGGHANTPNLAVHLLVGIGADF